MKNWIYSMTMLVLLTITSQIESSTVNRSLAIQLDEINSTEVKDTRSLCPSGWHYFNHHCYLFVQESETWFQAELNCRQNNSHLTSIISEEESKMVQSIALCHYYVWIGLVVTQQHNDLWKSPLGWSWWDNQPMLIKRFHSSYALTHLCRFAHYQNRLWHQNVCYARYFYVCKKRSLPPFSPYLENPSISDQPIAMQCRSNWTYFEGKCYRFFNQAVNYMRAEIHCRDVGGYLVTIENDQQQSFFQNEFGCDVKFWIGLQRMTPCSQKPLSSCWEWMDRSPLNYENWNDQSKEHDCAHSRGKWYNSVSCESKLYFACYTKVLESQKKKTKE